MVLGIYYNEIPIYSSSIYFRGTIYFEEDEILAGMWFFFLRPRGGNDVGSKLDPNKVLAWSVDPEKDPGFPEAPIPG